MSDEASNIVLNKVSSLLQVDQSAETVYHNDPKFSDTHVHTNSADSDQTAPRGAV